MSLPTGGVRLQKFLADAGLASRRKAETIIQSGRVRVNGQVVTELGTRVSPGKDLVVVDGAEVERKSGRRYILLYKPPGCVTTLSDPQGRPTARGYLKGVEERVFPVGRLDYDAEGALLFTDDGELANRLAHPSFGHRRIYLVKTKGDPDPAALRRMVEGVRLEDGPARALLADVHEKAEKNTWVKIVVGEGRNHLVKRLFEAVGLPVLRLYRPEFGGVTVSRLQPGRWRDLTGEELSMMKRSASVEPGEEGRNPLPLDLPKAGRRHGHGPPSQTAASDQQPADRARDERRAEEAEEVAARGRKGRDRREPATHRGGRAVAGLRRRPVEARGGRGGPSASTRGGGRDAGAERRGGDAGGAAAAPRTQRGVGTRQDRQARAGGAPSKGGGWRGGPGQERLDRQGGRGEPRSSAPGRGGPAGAAGPQGKRPAGRTGGGRPGGAPRGGGKGR
ncbi:MAG: rRNA pseudouridine synthase [Anaeromyxobacter sp.]|nr:rRNA pseudouridine synthase [Anaeromyxobacter sp.]MBL0277937.1 rRNA pseudouridine synthase [Anaeromyxobacter sp.]